MANPSFFSTSSSSPIQHAPQSVKPVSQPFSQKSPDHKSGFITPPRSPSMSQCLNLSHDSRDGRIGGLNTPPYTPDTSPKEPARMRDKVGFTASFQHDANNSSILPFMPPLATRLKVDDVFAQGQWSTVCTAHPEALNVAAQQQNILRTASVVAVKIGSGKLAKKVIEHEAKILTYLAQSYRSQDFVVRFLGYDAQTEGIVMEFVELTLEAFATTMVNQTWEIPLSNIIDSIARQLIHGLDFLHCQGIIHSDVKPANILLRPHISGRIQTKALKITSPSCYHTQYHALYCDFSASRYDTPDSIPNDSAQTFDYMAPELFTTKQPECYPTRASDVFALGITILYAIIGKSPYEFGHNSAIKRAMAIQGTPLNFISSDLEAANRMKVSGMEAFVSPALKFRANDRCSTAKWVQIIEKS